MASDQEKKRINKASIDGVYKDSQPSDELNADESNFKLSLQKVIDGIENGRLSLYIYKEGGQKLKIIVSESANRNKYLKIES